MFCTKRRQYDVFFEPLPPFQISQTYFWDILIFFFEKACFTAALVQCKDAVYRFLRSLLVPEVFLVPELLRFKTSFT